MPYSLTNVLKGTSAFSFGQILTKASAFFLIPLYTRFLTPADYGIVGYLQVIIQFMSVFLMFGLYGSQARFYYDYNSDKEEVGELLFSINIYLLLILLSFCTAMTFCGKQMYIVISSNPDISFSPYIILAIWIVFFQVFNQIIIRFYVATKKFKKCAILQYMSFLIGTACVILFVVYFRQGALGQMKGLFYGNLLFFFFFYWGYAKHFRFKFSHEKLKYALMYGLPLVFHLLAGVTLNLIDRVILARFVSLEELGIYTLGYNLGMVMSVLVGSINQAWGPNYYDLMKDESKDHSREIKRFFYLWLAVIGTVCLIGSLWSQEIIIFLTPAKFHSSAKIVPIILFGYVFQGLYFFAVNPIMFYKKTKILPITTGLSALLNIILNLILIPKHGIIGAAYATVASYIFMAGIVYIVGRRLYNPGYNLLKTSTVLFVLFLGSIMIKLPQGTLTTEIIKLVFLFSFIVLTYSLFYKYFRLSHH